MVSVGWWLLQHAGAGVVFRIRVLGHILGCWQEPHITDQDGRYRVEGTEEDGGYANAFAVMWW